MDLQLDDLLPLCSECDGRGEVANPELKQHGGSFGTSLVWASPVPCPACGGKGVIPTPAGKVLMDFIRRAKAKHLLD